MRVVGFDGKKIKIKLAMSKANQSSYFEALLGVGITVQNYEIFAKTYDQLIEKCFTKYSLKRHKVLYKGSDLVGIFYGLGIDLIPELIRELLPIIESVDIFYHYVPKYYDADSKTLNSIGVYYEEETQKITNVEYLDLIEGTFPAICCFSYISGSTEVKDTSYVIDECPGIKPSKAVMGVVSHPNTRFLFRGDLVNYAVNVADLFCKYIEDRVKKDNLIFDRNALIKGLDIPETKCNFHLLTPNFIHALKPSRKNVLNISHKYPHPIYYFFNQADSSFGKAATELLENSEIYRLALKKASLSGGTVKFYAHQDQNHMTDEDFLVIHNEHAKKLAEELKGCGCPASIVNHTHFKN